MEPAIPEYTKRCERDTGGGSFFRAAAGGRLDSVVPLLAAEVMGGESEIFFVCHEADSETGVRFIGTLGLCWKI